MTLGTGLGKRSERDSALRRIGEAMTGRTTRGRGLDVLFLLKMLVQMGRVIKSNRGPPCMRVIIGKRRMIRGKACHLDGMAGVASGVVHARQVSCDPMMFRMAHHTGGLFRPAGAGQHRIMRVMRRAIKGMALHARRG